MVDSASRDATSEQCLSNLIFLTGTKLSSEKFDTQ
jgi:hypothetical protein